MSSAKERLFSLGLNELNHYVHFGAGCYQLTYFASDDGKSFWKYGFSHYLGLGQ